MYFLKQQTRYISLAATSPPSPCFVRRDAIILNLDSFLTLLTEMLDPNRRVEVARNSNNSEDSFSTEGC